MFEWDEQKNEANISKHRVDFEEVIPVFFSREALIVQDNRKDYGEDRFIILCPLGGRVLHVTYTRRGVSVRIISARRANNRERRLYEQHQA
ncbi:MAG: BrnT family toxin [Geminicoccaceae bacterium]